MMAISFGSRREQRTDWARANQATEKRVPQSIHRGIDTMIELDNRIVRPEAFPNLLARNHFPGRFEQHPEYLKGLILKPDPEAVFEQLGRPHIELKRAETDIGSRAAARAGFSSRLHLRILV